MFGDNSCAKSCDETHIMQLLNKIMEVKKKFVAISASLVILTISDLWISLAYTHELWLEPTRFHLNTNEMLEVNIKLGEKLQGATLPFLPASFEEFYWIQNGDKKLIKSRLGDRPAFSAPVSEDGLISIIYVSKVSTLRYQTFEKFEKFAQSKDLGPVRQLHVEHGFSENQFSEIYSRFAKAIVSVGSGLGKDRSFGLTTEFILLNNPYENKNENFVELKLLYEGTPRSNAQIEIFERSDDGNVKITTTKTLSNGIAEVPIKPGSEYLFNAVKLRRAEANAPQNAVWETLWASLMVKIPRY